MIETIINSCLHHQCLLTVTTTHPFTNTQSFIGVLTPENNTKDKIRIHLYDAVRRVFLYDDIGEKMYMTIHKSSIKNITPLTNMIYSIKTQTSKVDHKTRLYNAYSALRKPSIKKIDNVEDYLFSQGFIHENVLSVKQKSRVIPVLSYQLKYNTYTNVYEKKLYIHHEQSLHVLLNFVPKKGPVEHLARRFKAFIKPHLTINEDPFIFIMRPRFRIIKPSMITRSMHHPYRALNHGLTPKNLGRKLYLLPPFNTKNSAQLYQTIASSLTHPVTLSHLPYSFTEVTQAYQKSATLNQTNALIIAPVETVKTLTNCPLALPLINHTVLDEAIDNFLNMKETIPEPSSLPPIDYHDFFNHIKMTQQKSQDIYLLNYLKYLFDDNAMSEYAIRLDAVIDQASHRFSCDVSMLYTLASYQSHVEDALHYHQAKRRNKLSLSLYKEIYDVFMMKDKEKRRKEVLKWLDKPASLKRLKNLFPIILVDAHARLYPHQITFDMLVAYNHNNLAYYQLGLAPKITMITKRHHYIGYDKRAPFITSQYPIFDQFHLTNNRTVKQFNMPNPILNRSPKIHNVKAINYAKHTVYNHTEYIQDIRNKTTEPLAIRTPFQAQKTMLKSNLTIKDLHTIYVPTSKRLILSLPIHPQTPKQTYDWIKNHPYIEKTLQHSPLDIIVDLDMIYEFTSHEDELAKALDAYHHIEHHAHYMNVDKLIDAILSLCFKDSQVTIKHNIPLTDLFSTLIIPSLKTISYIIYNASHTIFCIELPHTMSTSHYQLLIQACKQQNATLITYFSSQKRYIDNLINTLKTIDLIKAR